MMMMFTRELSGFSQDCLSNGEREKRALQIELSLKHFPIPAEPHEQSIMIVSRVARIIISKSKHHQLVKSSLKR